MLSQQMCGASTCFYCLYGKVKTMSANEKKNSIRRITEHPAFQLGIIVIYMIFVIFFLYRMTNVSNNHESENNDSNVAVVETTLTDTSTKPQQTTTRSTEPITDEVTTSVSETQSSVSTTQETTTSTTTTTAVIIEEPIIIDEPTESEDNTEYIEEEPLPEEEEEIPIIEEGEPSIVVDTSCRPVIYDCTLSDDVQQYIYDRCNEYGVPYELIMAIIKKESTFNPNASNGSCVGLMQLNAAYNSATAASLGVSLYDACGNALVGITTVADLLNRYSIHDALMCYNMGEYGARNYLGGTTSYSRTVVAYYNEYLNQ